MTEKTTPETLPEVAERKAPKSATYRALLGFNYPRPGGPIETTSPGGKPIKSAEVRVEQGEKGLSLPEAVIPALLGMGAIVKE